MNGLGTHFKLRREAFLASITVIPKIGKDATLCSSYRPIALLNAHTKLFAKILATRINDLMRDWIHADQVGFVAVREGSRDTLFTK